MRCYMRSRCTDCSFAASGEYLQLHFLQEHDELYKSRVPKFETDADIEAWREGNRPVSYVLLANSFAV